MAKKQKEPEPKKGAPAYMVSFGDMMTLILCFFILLVSMSTERNYGMMAKGVGSFIVAIQSHGLNGIMDGAEKQAVFDHVRRKFNLPPEEDPERRDSHLTASALEMVKADLLKALEPRHETRQPKVAEFDKDSATLTREAQQYLAFLADWLRPNKGMALLLEGHALDAGPNFQGDNTWLAVMRAQAVRTYLIDEYGFKPDRVFARAWLSELTSPGPGTRCVDARLTIPVAEKKK